MRARRYPWLFGLDWGAIAALSVGCRSSAPTSAPTSSEASPVSTRAPPGTPPPASACTGAHRLLATGRDPATDPLTRVVDRIVSIGGVDRTYADFLPATYGAKPFPLAIGLPGYQEGYKIHMVHSRLVNAADKHGLVTVAPQGTGTGPSRGASTRPATTSRASPMVRCSLRRSAAATPTRLPPLLPSPDSIDSPAAHHRGRCPWWLFMARTTVSWDTTVVSATPPRRFPVSRSCSRATRASTRSRWRRAWRPGPRAMAVPQARQLRRCEGS